LPLDADSVKDISDVVRETIDLVTNCVNSVVKSLVRLQCSCVHMRGNFEIIILSDLISINQPMKSRNVFVIGEIR